jgi:hypothetical protein
LIPRRSSGNFRSFQYFDLHAFGQIQKYIGITYDAHKQPPELIGLFSGFHQRLPAYYIYRKVYAAHGEICVNQTRQQRVVQFTRETDVQPACAA